MLTADALVRWFQSFHLADLSVDAEQLQCLTSNVNLDEIWQRIIRHCHPTEHVKKVKETLKIVELKCRHPDRWEQHANAQIQQGQFEQRIGTRLREISAARHDQSTHLINEFHRLESMIDEEFSQISSYEKQGEIYRQFTSLFTTLVQSTGNNVDSSRSKDLHELCSSLNPLVQQRINQLKSLELADDRSSFVEIYEEALNKVNFEFTKQFVHAGNIRLECDKVRERLNESKRDVLSRRSTSEQSQLNSILDAMISSKSIDVHLNLLKKKIQSECEASTKKSEEKHLPRLHQQLNDKRTELNRIDQQLNLIIQDNPADKLDKLETKLRDYLRLLTDLPGRIHALNLMHLSLGNDLRSNLLNWPVDNFSHLTIPSSPVDTSSPLPALTSETPPTPLTSLKQLLGIRTQDVVQLEPPSIPATERWNDEESDERDEIETKKLPTIASIDWDLFTRVDQQMEQALKQCQEDSRQYDQIFQNLLSEVNVFQSESLFELK